tara:strand:- start:20569 stop:21513 length:945 start_codon:yes stop_codon:yes gene_type:complete
MQIDQNILNAYNKSKSNLESITQRFIDIVTKDVVISENLFYKIVLSNSSYQRVQILFFKNKESMQKHNSFKTDRYKTKKEEGLLFSVDFNMNDNKDIDYNLSFESLYDRFSKNEIFTIEEGLTLVKEIIKIIEVSDYNFFSSLFEEFTNEFSIFEKRNKEMKANEKAYQDYLHSLTFEKIMTLFSKDDKIANDIYEEAISTYYHDQLEQFVTIERDYDKVQFRRIKVESKNNQKLSLMYKGSRISKADLKKQLKKDVILFNGNILKTIEETVNTLNIKNLPVYSEYTKISDYGVGYNIDIFFEFFRKHIIANEF